MKIDFYRCDAFTTEPGKGNPAGVVPDARGLSDEQMQKIAAWANYSERRICSCAILRPGRKYRCAATPR